MKDEKEKTFALKPLQLEYLFGLQCLSGFYLRPRCILLNKANVRVIFENCTHESYNHTCVTN